MAGPIAKPKGKTGSAYQRTLRSSMWGQEASGRVRPSGPRLTKDHGDPNRPINGKFMEPAWRFVNWTPCGLPLAGALSPIKLKTFLAVVQPSAAIVPLGMDDAVRPGRRRTMIRAHGERFRMALRMTGKPPNV
jgi:hypothetical protein